LAAEIRRKSWRSVVGPTARRTDVAIAFGIRVGAEAIE
jgi:hypothetical protein